MCTFWEQCRLRPNNSKIGMQLPLSLGIKYLTGAFDALSIHVLRYIRFGATAFTLSPLKFSLLFTKRVHFQWLDFTAAGLRYFKQKFSIESNSMKRRIGSPKRRVTVWTKSCTQFHFCRWFHLITLNQCVHSHSLCTLIVQCSIHLLAYKITFSLSQHTM